MSPASYQTAPPRVAMESGKRDSNPRPRECHSRALPTELRPRYIGPRKTRSGGNTASYLDVVAVSSVFAPVRELFGLCLVTQGDPGLIDMPKHIRRKKTTSPARAKPRAAARAVAAPAKPAPAKKRGRRRGLLSGLGTHEHERDILDQYLHEVSKTPLLTQKEEIALARKVRAGDQESMQELVKRNLRFVISVAKKYQNRGLPLTDLIGEGNVGLLTAARKFDPDQGVKFISYAVWWIRQAILAALARQGRTVRVPLNRTADLSRIVRTAEFLRQTLRREPTPEEISDATKLSLEVVQSLAARALHRRGSPRHRRSGDGPVPVGRNRAGAEHVAAPRRQGVASVLRAGRRPRAYTRRDRWDARCDARPRAPAAGPRAQAAAGRRGGEGPRKLRGVNAVPRCTLHVTRGPARTAGLLRCRRRRGTCNV